ncbi:MAG: hypothetical protein RR262_09365 [Clostridium sp.]
MKGDKIVATLEYDIKNIYEGVIINFSIFDEEEALDLYNADFTLKKQLIKGFADEIAYWNSHLKRVVVNEENNFTSSEILSELGFEKQGLWTLTMDNPVEVFKIYIKEITPEQLTVDKAKLNKVDSWIEKPEQVIISCVKIEDKIVSIDGHSRLVSAFNKGFQYVYGYFEADNGSMEFYKTCMEWCEEAGILTIQDLSKHVVSPEEHEKLWISRCQEYFRNH